MPSKKFLASITGTALLFGLSTGVYAGANLQEIKAYLNGDLKVRVNGAVPPLKDEQGIDILPITYEGSTYLPVRAVANALNVAVDYDAANQEVILGERVNGTPLNDEDFSPYYHTKDPAQTTYNNKNYKDAYYFHGSGGPTLHLFPDKRYQTLHLKLAALDKADLKDIKIEDSDRNVILKDVGTLSPKDGLKEIVVDIGNVKDVRISMQVDTNGGFFIPLIDSYYQ